jgi:hypothetical protein
MFGAKQQIPPAAQSDKEKFKGEMRGRPRVSSGGHAALMSQPTTKTNGATL